MKIDWSKAPEGATHWDAEHDLWCCKDGWWSCSGKFYEDNDQNGWGGDRYITRAGTWTGEGLPPAGAVCEVLNNTLDRPEWERCTVLFMGKFKAVYESESCHERVADVSESWMISFRPLRTPEQIAAEEREKAIKELIYTTCISHGEAARIYDAGWRKQQ